MNKITRQREVEVIMTFDKKPQRIRSVMIPENKMYSKEDFLEVIVNEMNLDQEQMLELVKISTCLIGSISSDLETHMIGDNRNKGWYMKYGGKFYRQCGDFNTLYNPFYILHRQEGGQLVEVDKTSKKKSDGSTLTITDYKLTGCPSHFEVIGGLS